MGHVMVRHIEVVLLNGQRLDVMCDVNTTARQVFDVVVTHLGLPEHYFFGMTFLKGNQCSAYIISWREGRG